MKIIDLLNKIANGEEVPSKIEYRNIKFLYDKNNKLYIVENYNKYTDLLMELSNYKGTDLNYEVEILEEEKKFTKEDFIKEAMDLEDITREEFNKRYEVKECNCYREYCKGFIKVEKVQEENKIPEKLKWVDYNTEFTHGELNKEFRNICNTIDEIIDFLKSKGE